MRKTPGTFDNTDHDVSKSVILGEELKKVLISKEEAVSYIPEWIEEGKKFIWPELRGERKEEVEYFAKGLHRGGEIMQALYVLRKLDEGGDCKQLNKELIDLYADEASRMGLSDTRRLILLFSKRGVEFSREGQNHNYYVNSGSKEREAEFIRSIEERNFRMFTGNKDLYNTLNGQSKNS